MGDITNFNIASLRGGVPTSYLSKTQLKNDGESICIQGNLLYVVYYQSGNTAPGFTAPDMEIYDITVPAAPLLVGTLPAFGETYGDAKAPVDVFVQGHYAYILRLKLPGFSIVDVSNPASPTIVATYTGATSAFTQSPGLWIQGRYAYLSGSDATSPYIEVIDLENPVSPSLIYTLSLSSAFDSVYTLFYAQDRYLYAVSLSQVTATATFNVIDISNPHSISIVGTLALSVSASGSGGFAPSIRVQGRYAYVGLANNGTVAIVDVGAPTAPTLLTTYNPSLGDVGTVQVRGNVLFVSGLGSDEIVSNGGIQLVDITNPASPVMLGNLDYTEPYYEFDIIGNYLFGSNNIATETDAEYYTYLTVWNLGSMYLQHLEAGNIKTEALAVTGPSAFVGDMSVQGAVTLGRNLFVIGDVAITGNLAVSGTGTPVLGPNSSTIGDIPVFNTTAGTGLSDSGIGLFSIGTNDVLLGIGVNSISSSGGNNVFLGQWNPVDHSIGDRNVVIGGLIEANVADSRCTIIGYNITQANATGNTLVGAYVGGGGGSSFISGNYNSGVGFGAFGSLTTGVGNSTIGVSTGNNNLSTGNYNILLGYYADTASASTSNVCVIGGWDGSAGGITDVFIGRSQEVAAGSLQAVTIHSTDTTLTSNAAATTSSLNIAGGRGTGTGAGGSVNLQTAPAGSSGSTQNALVTGLSLASTGALTLGPTSTTPTHALNTSTATGSGTSTLGASNSPGASTPVGWISIIINGTTQYIPYF